MASAPVVKSDSSRAFFSGLFKDSSSAGVHSLENLWPTHRRVVVNSTRRRTDGATLGDARVYLPECAGGDAQVVNHEDRNQKCGGESEPPAEGGAPPRIRRGVVELQRSVFHQGENERRLKTRKNNLRDTLESNETKI